MLILLGYDQYRSGRGGTFPRSGSVQKVIKTSTPIKRTEPVALSVLWGLAGIVGVTTPYIPGFYGQKAELYYGVCTECAVEGIDFELADALVESAIIKQAGFWLH